MGTRSARSLSVFPCHAESIMNAGTSLRELVHKFRQRTLILVKALMLQKKVALDVLSRFGY